MTTGVILAEPEDLAELDLDHPVATRVERRLCTGRLRDGRSVLVEVHPLARAGGLDHRFLDEVRVAAESGDDRPRAVAQVLGGGRLHDGAFATIIDDPRSRPLRIDTEADLDGIIAEAAAALVWIDGNRPTSARTARGWLRQSDRHHLFIADSGVAPTDQLVAVGPDDYADDEPFLAPELIDRGHSSNALDLTGTGAIAEPATVYALAAGIVDACSDEIRPLARERLGDALDPDPARRPGLRSLAGASVADPESQEPNGTDVPNEAREGRQRLGTLALFLLMVVIAAVIGWSLSQQNGDTDAAATSSIPPSASSSAPVATGAAPGGATTAPPAAATPSTVAPTTPAPTEPAPTTAAPTTAAPTTTVAPPPVEPIAGYRLVTVNGEIATVGVVIEPALPLDQPDLPPPSGSTAPVVGGVGVGADIWIVRSDGALDLVSGLAPTQVLLDVELADDEAIVAVTSAPGGAWALLDNGSVRSIGTAAAIVGSAPAPAGQVLVSLVPTSDGGVHVIDSGGGVQTLGSDSAVVGVALADGARRVVSAARPARSSGDLWLIDDQGTVLSLGDAPPLPALPDLLDGPLQAPIVDSLSSPDGTGLWLIGADGGVFALGTADFLGRASAVDQPIAAVIAPN